MMTRDPDPDPDLSELVAHSTPPLCLSGNREGGSLAWSHARLQDTAVILEIVVTAAVLVYTHILKAVIFILEKINFLEI